MDGGKEEKTMRSEFRFNDRNEVRPFFMVTRVSGVGFIGNLHLLVPQSWHSPQASQPCNTYLHRVLSQ